MVFAGGFVTLFRLLVQSESSMAFILALIGLALAIMTASAIAVLHAVDDFRVGSSWLYAMVGPDNTKHWARADYTAIDPKKSFHVTDSFCDENGNKTNDAPSMQWNRTILDMGFEQGFTAGLNNLDELLRGI